MTPKVFVAARLYCRKAWDVWDRVGPLCFGAHLQLLIHELGHAVANLIFGKRARSLRIGDGPSVWLFSRSRLPIQIGLYPLSGHCDVDIPVRRWQAALAYAAGPLSTILVAMVCFNYTPRSPLEWFRDAWLAIIFVLPGIDNLLPHRPDGKEIAGILRAALGRLGEPR